jgi:hypothetical protein
MVQHHQDNFILTCELVQHLVYPTARLLQGSEYSEQHPHRVGQRPGTRRLVYTSRQEQQLEMELAPKVHHPLKLCQELQVHLVRQQQAMRQLVSILLHV